MRFFSFASLTKSSYLAKCHIFHSVSKNKNMCFLTSSQNEKQLSELSFFEQRHFTCILCVDPTPNALLRIARCPTPNALLRIAGCPKANALLRITGCPTLNALLHINVPYFLQILCGARLRIKTLLRSIQRNSFNKSVSSDNTAQDNDPFNIGLFHVCTLSSSTQRKKVSFRKNNIMKQFLTK